MSVLHKQIKIIARILFLFFCAISLVSLILIAAITQPEIFSKKPEYIEVVITKEKDENQIINGIHQATGLKDGPGLMTVIQNCTNCHSSKLLTQNRMNRERWQSTIKWMQETQNLWDLGKNEDIIINYLTTNYPIVKKGRRQNLKNIEWHQLN